MSPVEALQQLWRDDGNFEGRGPEARQLAIVSADGRTAVHTGADAAQANWAGARSGKGYSIQGNSLVGPQVLEEMERAFLANTAPLAERLLAALTAGDRAGGQQTGRESAALLVRTRAGFPLDVDLRVDHSDDPVAQLRFRYGLQSARQDMIQARIAGRRGDYEKAKGLLTFAFNRASTWPRACIRAAQVAVEIDQPVLAAKYLALALDRSPAWIPKTIGNGTFACLVHDRTFHRWISPDLQKDAMVDYRKAQASKESSGADCLVLAERLLEVGYGTAALAVRENAVSSSPDVILLRATARADQGNLPAAVKQVDAGLKLNPGDARLKLRLARLPC